jgi:hypothetical protein
MAGGILAIAIGEIISPSILNASLESMKLVLILYSFVGLVLMPIFAYILVIIGVLIASYVRQYPKTPPNQTAIDFQASMAKLGIPFSTFGDGSKSKIQPQQSVLKELQPIDSILNEYVNQQLDRSEETVQKSPAKLHDYLIKHRSDLDEITQLLASKDLPNWGSDSGYIERGDRNAGDSYYGESSYSLSVLIVSKLLMANLFDRQLSANIDNSKSLMALQSIGRSFHTGTTLLAQLY